MITNQMVVDEARSYMGIKWRHQGRSRVHGIDCAGLIVCVAHKLEITDYDFSAYPKVPDGKSFLKHFKNNLATVRLSPGMRGVMSGDIVVMRDKHYPCHCGFLVIENGKLNVIHARADRHKVVEEPLTPEHKPVRVFRFHGIKAA